MLLKVCRGPGGSREDRQSADTMSCRREHDAGRGGRGELRGSAGSEVPTQRRTVANTRLFISRTKAQQLHRAGPAPAHAPLRAGVVKVHSRPLFALWLWDFSIPHSSQERSGPPAANAERILPQTNASWGGPKPPAQREHRSSGGCTWLQLPQVPFEGPHHDIELCQANHRGHDYRREDTLRTQNESSDHV